MILTKKSLLIILTVIVLIMSGCATGNRPLRQVRNAEVLGNVEVEFVYNRAMNHITPIGWVGACSGVAGLGYLLYGIATVKTNANLDPGHIFLESAHWEFDRNVMTTGASLLGAGIGLMYVEGIINSVPRLRQVNEVAHRMLIDEARKIYGHQIDIRDIEVVQINRKVQEDGNFRYTATGVVIRY